MNVLTAAIDRLTATTPQWWVCPVCPRELPIHYDTTLDTQLDGDYYLMRLVETDRSLQLRKDHIHSHLTDSS